MIENKVVQAGAVNIIGADILTDDGRGANVLSQVERIVIYEDLFSPFMSGEITLRDTYDLPNAIGLQTRMLLRLNINTPSFSDDQNLRGYFLIYAMTDRQLASDRSTLFTYRFASEEIIYDVQRRISKTYRGNGSSIVRDILHKKLGSSKDYMADVPTNEITYTSNFWSPVQNIRYCIEHSTDSQGNPAYTFYEDHNGFNFRSLVEIAKEEKLMQYLVASDFIADVETSPDDKIRFGSASRNPNSDYSIIREFRIDTTFDYLDFLSKGGARTLLYTHDLVTKRIDIQKFDLVEEKHKLLNERRFLTDENISLTEPLILTASKYWDALDIGDKTNTKYLQKRISEIAQYQSFRIEVDIFGRSDYTVGKKVYVDVNQIRPISRDEEKDKYLDKVYSGYYIVSKIAHRIGRAEHFCTLELMKDSTLLK